MELNQSQIEFLRRMKPDVWYFDFLHLRIQTPTVYALMDLGYVKGCKFPRRGEDGKPLPDWEEKWQYSVGFRKIKEPEGDDITSEDLAVLEQLCDRYGHKTVSYLCHCRAWDGRKKVAEDEVAEEKRKAELKELLDSILGKKK